MSRLMNPCGNALIILTRQIPIARILTGGDTVEYKKGTSIKEFYEENKEWLQKIAMSGDIVVRSMALAIMELGADPEQ
jgi:hypothetical protein